MSFRARLRRASGEESDAPASSIRSLVANSTDGAPRDDMYFAKASGGAGSQLGMTPIRRPLSCPCPGIRPAAGAQLGMTPIRRPLSCPCPGIRRRRLPAQDDASELRSGCARPGAAAGGVRSAMLLFRLRKPQACRPDPTDPLTPRRQATPLHHLRMHPRRSIGPAQKRVHRSAGSSLVAWHWQRCSPCISRRCCILCWRHYRVRGPQRQAASETNWTTPTAWRARL